MDTIARTASVRTLFAALALSCVLAGCDIFSRWDAIVYTNRFDKSSAIDIGTFGSLEDCRAAALAKLDELKVHTDIGGYVCGENCLVKSGFDNTRMCARTAK